MTPNPVSMTNYRECDGVVRVANGVALPVEGVGDIFMFGVLGPRCCTGSDAGLSCTKGVWYIYDCDNWVVDTDVVGGLYRLYPYVFTR